MPTIKCETCKGSGFKGINSKIDVIDENVKIESLELVKCEAKCKSGFIYIIDNSSYNTKDAIR